MTRWSDEETEILKKQYPTNGSDVDELNRSKRSIQNKAFNMGLEYKNKLKEIDCDYCGKSITKYPCHITNHNFCSEECRAKWQEENFTGEDHPNWHDTEVKCKNCGESFHVSPCNRESTKYCSKECFREDKKNEHIFECAHCGEEVVKSGYQLKDQDRFFCDAQCKAKWQEENLRGKNNPSYNGGLLHEPYGEEWTKQRKEKVRERDNYECQFCGMPEGAHLLLHSKKLSIHHINGNKKNNRVGNLLTLCRICNSRWHGSFISQGDKI